MKKILALGTVLLLLILAGCATPLITQLPVAPAPQPTAMLDVLFPTGLFELKDTPARGLQFNKDNTFYVLADGNRVVEGTYSTKGNVYTETSNTVDCPSQMDYTFSFDGSNLTFKPVADPAKDPCDGRKTDFNASKTWVLMH